MKIESEFDGFRISKENRRNNQEAERGREGYSPFKLYPHVLKRKDRQRRAHLLERKALRRR